MHYSLPTFLKSYLACAVLFLLPLALAVDEFVFNGFSDNSLDLDGSATIMNNGLLTLTNASSYAVGHAFYPSPFHMRNLTDGSIFSFSANFIVAIPLSHTYTPPNDGIAFVLAPNTNFGETSSQGSFGLVTNDYYNGNTSNHIFAVELDISQESKYDDMDNNHVGIDINGMNSSACFPAGYYTDEGLLSNFHPLRLLGGKPMQVWIDYDHRLSQLNVTLAVVPMPKPKRPLLSSVVDLSAVLLDYMYVGFSSSSLYYSSRGYFGYNFVMGCSFKLNGEAAPLNLSRLPNLPGTDVSLKIYRDSLSPRIRISLVYMSVILLAFLTPIVYYLLVRRLSKYQELREDWEVEFGPHRFSYKELSKATDDFNDKQLLGAGGFGKVYKGILPSSKLEIAVKTMSHGSKQGMKEFIAEVVSMGRLRHRNLVQLLGYCRRKGELLLVYEYMPNGSLDNFLYDQDKPSLDWPQRFEIIKGVGSGLLYLHEEWEQVVIHRDIKASNVLLDSEMNSQLGDFGLARLHDHGVEAHTTCVAGTRGYISPELARLGKATKSTDVFAFGAFILEVACGQRPVGINSRGEAQLLVDFVLRFWQRELVVCIMDPRLGGEYVTEEGKLVLKLGLLCSHPSPAGRPSMRLVMQYLCGDVPFPEMPESYLSAHSFIEMQGNDDDFNGENPVEHYVSVQTSISSLSGGR